MAVERDAMFGSNRFEPQALAGWVWDRLEERKGAWRTPVLATADEDLGADARTVVLRDCDPADRNLFFYTARDADKVRQFTRESRCCMVVYDAEAGAQARLYGRGEPVLDKSWLDRAWQALADWQKEVYALQRRLRGKENFAAYRVHIDAMHLLLIAEDGRNEAFEFVPANENAAGDAGGDWSVRKVEP